MQKYFNMESRGAGWTKGCLNTCFISFILVSAHKTPFLPRTPRFLQYNTEFYVSIDYSLIEYTSIEVNIPLHLLTTTR